LAALRCNTCVYLKQGFCSRIGEPLLHRLAKLFYGGAIGLYSGTLTYPSECGIEKEQKRETGAEMKVFVTESIVQELP